MAILSPACTVAEFFHRLAEHNTPGTRKLLVKVDEVADPLALDDTLGS